MVIIYTETREERNKMTREAMRDYAARNWGLENENTINIFRMYEDGEDEKAMKDYIELVELAANDDEWED